MKLIVTFAVFLLVGCSNHKLFVGVNSAETVFKNLKVGEQLNSKFLGKESELESMQFDTIIRRSGIGKDESSVGISMPNEAWFRLQYKPRIDLTPSQFIAILTGKVTAERLVITRKESSFD